MHERLTPSLPRTRGGCVSAIIAVRVFSGVGARDPYVHSDRDGWR